MSGTNKHDTSLSNWSTSMSFCFSANLVDNDHLRHMVLNCFNHDFMLQWWFWNLHSSCGSNCWVRNIPVASYFIASINNDLNQFLFSTSICQNRANDTKQVIGNERNVDSTENLYSPLFSEIHQTRHGQSPA